MTRTRLSVITLAVCAFNALVGSSASAQIPCPAYRTDNAVGGSPANVTDMREIIQNGERAFYFAGDFVSGGTAGSGNVGSRGIIRLRVDSGDMVWEGCSPIDGIPNTTCRDIEVFDDGGGSAVYALVDGSSNQGLYRFRDNQWSVLSTARGFQDLVVHDDGTGPALLAVQDTQGGPDLLRWSGTEWVSVLPIQLLSPAAQHFSFAYDAARDQLVRFGGEVGGVYLPNTTWTWTRSTRWSLHAVPGPSPRSGASMTWDPIAQRVLLFGGQDASGMRSDFWEWDGTQWTERLVPTPPARSMASFAFDTTRARLVLTGGKSAAGTPIGDVWEWDGNSWTMVAATVPFTLRFGSACAFDPSRNQVMIYGGQQAAGVAANGTFGWDGTTWQTHTGPDVTGRIDAQLYFDPADQTLKMLASPQPNGQLLFFRRTTTGWQSLSSPTPVGLSPSRVAVMGSSGTLMVSGANGSLVERAAGTWVPIVPPTLGLSESRLTSVQHATGPALYIKGLAVYSDPAPTLARFMNGQLEMISRPAGSLRAECALGAPGQQELIMSVDSQVYRYTPGGAFELMNTPAGTTVQSLASVDLGNGPELVGNFTHLQGPTLRRFIGPDWSEDFGYCCSSYTAHQILGATIDGETQILLAANSSGGVKILASNCRPIEITQQPSPRIASLNTPLAQFSVRVTGSEPFTYQWRHNSIPMTNSDGTFGVTTQDLYVRSDRPTDAGIYDCVVTNEVDSVTTDPVTLTVRSVVPASGPFSMNAVLLPGTTIDGPASFSLVTRAHSPRISHNGFLAFYAELSDGTQSRLSIIADTMSGFPLVQSFPIPAYPDPYGLNNIMMLAPLSGGGVYGKAQASSNPFVDFAFVTNGDDVLPILDSRQPTPSLGYPTFRRQGIGEKVCVDASGALFLTLEVQNTLGQAAGFGVYRWTAAEGLTESVPPNVVINGEAQSWIRRVFRCAADDRMILEIGDGSGIAFRADSASPWQWLARRGDPIPGFSGEVFPYVRVALSDEGDIVISCVAPSHVFSWTPEDGLVHKFSTPHPMAPSPNTFLLQKVIGVASSGDILLEGSVREPGGSWVNEGVYLYRSGQIVPVLQRIDTTPLWLAAQNGWINDLIAYHSISVHGEVLVSADVVVDNLHRTGIFGWTPQSGLFPILIPGSHLTLGDNVVRQIQGAWVTEDLSRNSPAISNNHQFAFTADFVNPSTAVLKGNFLNFLQDWHPCPTVLDGPPTITLRPGQPLILSRAAAGEAPLALQWMHNQQPLADGTMSCGGVLSGTHTETLTKSFVCADDAGQYQLNASNNCGASASGVINVIVLCVGDFDGDSDTDSDDIIGFFSAWDAGDPAADVDGDDDADSDDIIAFFSAWDAGC